MLKSGLDVQILVRLRHRFLVHLRPPHILHPLHILYPPPRLRPPPRLHQTSRTRHNLQLLSRLCHELSCREEESS